MKRNAREFILSTTTLLDHILTTLTLSNASYLHLQAVK
jgi:hypothetical protein